MNTWLVILSFTTAAIAVIQNEPSVCANEIQKCVLNIMSTDASNAKGSMNQLMECIKNIPNCSLTSNDYGTVNVLQKLGERTFH
ncbi:hypothetical protein PHET_02727 [Paragonimus heterotremus]|uniref:Uncharacterized protein n=1 Tax=Paragonimus heterotremus TaxID=100268 RepID=A0A8J4T1K0_9TREM|nr:hypothetical protein PHET_02727 [Paragonimus heterotremus]